MGIFKKIYKNLYKYDLFGECLGNCYAISYEETGAKIISLKNAIKANISFLFLTEKLNILTMEEAIEFLEIINNMFDLKHYRYIIWIRNIKKINKENINALEINTQHQVITKDLSIKISDNLTIQTQRVNYELRNQKLYLKNNCISPIAFMGKYPLENNKIDTCYISFEKENLGCLNFRAFFDYTKFNKNFDIGFELFFTHESEKNRKFLPLISEYITDSKYIGYNFCLDPVDIFNQVSKDYIEELNINNAYKIKRSYINLTGKNFNNNEIYLNSFYKTIYNENISLKPIGSETIDKECNLISRLTFCNNSDTNAQNSIVLAPEGDFCILNKSNKIELLCGLSATETLVVKQKDVLRFIACKPACGSNFPLKKFTPVYDTYNPEDKALTNNYTTSWLTIYSDDKYGYISEPKNAPFYGEGKLDKDLLEREKLETSLKVDTHLLYPLFPYVGVKPDEKGDFFTKEKLKQFENTVISPLRKEEIDRHTFTNFDTNILKHKTHKKIKEEKKLITTTSGQIVEVFENIWMNIYLAQNTKHFDLNNNIQKLYFEQPSIQLMQAFMSSELFLVIANPINLGECTNNFSPIGKSAFHNNINIMDWNFNINIGMECKYEKYKNIMIVKGCKGKLYEPLDKKNSTNQSLVSNIQMWTKRNEFSSPITDKEPDNNQHIILSHWLVKYFDDAFNMKNEYFNNFNKIATDPNWQGILFLRVSVKEESIPDSLSGITSGIEDKEDFYLHHMGINITPLKKEEEIVQDSTSSLFGLIYYVDKEYDDAVDNTVKNIRDPYDFKLLTFKVLFENAAIKKLESLAQLTLKQILGQKVKELSKDDCSHTIKLKGNCQINDNVPSYSLQSTKSSEINLESNIIKKIIINNIKMETIDRSNNSYWFNINGKIDFFTIKYKDDGLKEFEFDILSFDGLFFNNLGVEMLEKNHEKKYSMSIEKFGFDLTMSTYRKDSLYKNFQLQADKLICGDENKEINSLSYASVITNAHFSEISKKNWYAIKYKLNIGTLGELSQKADLSSGLIIAWSTDCKDDNYEIYIGANLFGTGTSGGFSVQSILKLSIGQTWLIFDENKKQFALMLTNVVLKLFGLKKIPPNGSSILYIFGDSEAKENELGWFGMYQNK